jgi:hydroxyacylglutathione hydrolase
MGVFTGDFIFVGDVGRPDLLERAANFAGTMEQGARTLFHSLERFRRLPERLTLWPGHGAGSACGKNLGSLPSTTLAYEKLTNWGVRLEDEHRFVEEVLAGQPEPPAYFKEMKRLNKAGPPVLGGFRDPAALEPERIVELLERGETVIDVRTSAENGAGFIPGTLHIPAGSIFTTWAGWLLSYGRPFYLLAPNAEVVRAAVRDLAMIGLDDVAGWLPLVALEAWSAKHGPLAKRETLDVSEAFERFKAGKVTMLDVRGMNEAVAGHVPGEHHIPLGYLAARVSELPAGVPIAVHCAGGARSPIAVSVLRRAGRADAFDVLGGFDAHRGAGLPVETGEGERAKV